MSDLWLWLDANVARNPTNVRTIQELAQKKGIAVVVPAQVHLEICRQMREKKGAAFSQDRITSFLDQLGIQVVDTKLDRGTAEEWAALLNQRYPTSDAWKAAKLSAVKARLPEDASCPAKRVPMTTDWLIALEVEQRGSYVAVEDKGEEWSGLRAMSPRRALSYSETLQWLSEQPDAQP